MVAAGSPQAVVAGARVDVIVTTERRARLALEDVEVLAARAALAAEEGKGPRVLATLRVSVEQAVYLVAAQSFARDVRLLARAPGDERVAGGLRRGALKGSTALTAGIEGVGPIVHRSLQA